MGKPLVWGPRASRERRGGGSGGVSAEVNEKGLLQVRLSYYNLKRDPGSGWYAKEGTGEANISFIIKEILDTYQIKQQN